MTVFTHPASSTGRISNHQGIIRNVPGNHSACTNKGISSDTYPANNGRVGSDSRTFLHQRWFVLILPDNCASGVDHIGENRRWPQKNIVFTNHSGINRNVVLNFNVVTKLSLIHISEPTRLGMISYA